MKRVAHRLVSEGRWHNTDRDLKREEEEVEKQREKEGA
jgi:hypothetical protein